MLQVVIHNTRWGVSSETSVSLNEASRSFMLSHTYGPPLVFLYGRNFALEKKVSFYLI